MEGWVNKKAILHYCNHQHRGRIEYLLRGYNRSVPCSISFPFNTPKLFINIKINGWSNIDFHIPREYVYFTSHYLKYSLPMSCWEKHQEMIAIHKSHSKKYPGGWYNE